MGQNTTSANDPAPASAADLAALEQLASEATPGPWWRDREAVYAPAGYPWSHPAAPYGATARGVSWGSTYADGDYIVAAANAVPGLVAEVRRLRSRNAALQQALVRVLGKCGNCGAPAVSILVSSRFCGEHNNGGAHPAYITLNIRYEEEGQP